ncbi:MAG TPA: dephospho-CoA kinase [Phycisphaerae bacterium]|nr:dephospho-CoA kinase [Phycisphaerae bacterium]
MAGGIGSGKSTVASILESLGAGVISSDRLNHTELDSPEVLAQLREWWGDRVVDSQGRANRAVLREIVRGDEAARRRLENLTHPRIDARRRQMMAEFQADSRIRAIVWDSPLLFEAGLADACDYIIFVEADPATRLARVRQTRNWTEEDLERFEKMQKPLDFKRQRADYIVENNSDMDAVRREVESIFFRILSAAETSCG